MLEIHFLFLDIHPLLCDPTVLVLSSSLSLVIPSFGTLLHINNISFGKCKMAIGTVMYPLSFTLPYFFLSDVRDGAQKVTT